MKKLLSTVILASFLISITFISSSAQNRGDIKLGAGLLYDTDVATAGIQANGVFQLFDVLALAPNVNIYFPGGDDPGSVQNLWSVNLNGHLTFTTGPYYHIYGLGGLNFSFPKVEGRDDVGTDYALNIGVGGEYQLTNFSIFGEIKYMVKSNRSVVLGVGARFPLN